jgi:two-component system, NarL family, response regulator
VSATPIRVLIADDHLILRYGLTTFIRQQPDMDVVAEASNGQEVVEMFRVHRPDVTLVDLRMPGQSGVEAIEAIRKLDAAARIIVLTIHRGDEAVYRAIRAGARGYLLKDVPFEELLVAIRNVHAGGQSIPPEIAFKMAERIRHDELTPREIQVLKLAASGLANKQIADRLGVAEGTVKHYVVVILAKLEAQDRTHAVSLAIERGIIHIEDVDLEAWKSRPRP